MIAGDKLDKRLSDYNSQSSKWRRAMKTVAERVEQEQKQFGDLLIIPQLIDTYGNLPLKLKALLQW